MTDLPPAREPLCLAEIKANMRIESDDEDALIEGLIPAARAYVENVTGQVLTRRLVTDTAPSLGRWIDLTAWPVASVSEIRCFVDGQPATIASTSVMCSYARRPVRLYPAVPGWGVPGGYEPALRSRLPVEIDVVAGYATPSDVPPEAKQAMHLLITHWYSNRSAVESGARAAAVTVPLGVPELLRGLRLARV